MTTLLPEFNKASILVVGDVMLDRYWFGDAARISPEAPVPVVSIKQTDDRAGGAGNVALNIAALGAKTTLLGLSGADDAATFLKNQLKASGVNYFLQPINTIPTIVKHRIISRHQQLIRLDFEEKIPAFDTEILIERFKQELAHCNLVILSDYKKGTLACAQKLIELANAAHVPVFVDPKGVDFTQYKGATVITPNLKEFEAVVGPCNSEQDIISKGQQFLKQHDIATLLLTRGERGMTLIQNNKDEIHLPAHAREVFDVTGAGDTVIATLAAAYAGGATLEHAMELANLAAGLVVSKLGAATISVPELKMAVADATIHKTGILNEDQLLLAMSEAKAKGKKVVFTNGCFDILHAGHVTYLQQAKLLGDYLVVAVNDDQSVKRLKGESRPINTVEQRMAVLASLGVVDWVVSFADDTPKRLLKKLKPQVLVKGGDYNSIDEVVGSEIVLAYGGDVRVLGVVKNISTTLIIDRMIQQHITSGAN